VIPVGTTSVYDSDQFGVTSAAINNQGTIRFNSANAFVLNNSVAGTGGLEQRGIGVLTLAGNNSFSGNLNIGQGSVVLAHNQALGQGDVVSNGGALGLSSSVVLPRLRVNGDITINTAMRTTGDQVYNGSVIFNFSGTPTDSNDPSVRLANFASTDGNLSFMGTVGAGSGAKDAQRSLVVSAANGRVTFNDQVGYGVVDPLTPTFRTIGFGAYSNNSASNPWTVNPWAVDVVARTIALNANVTTSETQRYSGATLVGDNGRNGFTRLLVSLDPSITFEGTVDDTAKGQHSLVLRAIALNDNETPSIQLGDVGLTTPLASLDVLAGLQSTQNNSLVAEISPNRSTFIGNLTLEGSVKTVGNQTYVANAIALGSANNPIVLNTEKGTIEAITGQRGGTSTPIQGLDNTRFERGPRASGVGANLRANALEQGRALNEKIVGRLPSEESEQFGSGMVQSLKRAIELSRGKPLQLDELQELKKLDNLSAEVMVGDMQVATEPARVTDKSQSITTCRESDTLVADNEQCQTTN
jgi:autotransporter-associated beta strand protein